MVRSYKYLYTLWYIDPDDGQRYVFYVGRTSNLDRRTQEHSRSWKTGHESKYKFIREVLEPRGIDWMLTEYKRVPLEEYAQDWERFAVIQHIREHHPIMNEKHGDLDNIDTDVADVTIRNVADVKAKRVERDLERERKAFERSDNLRKRVLEEERIAEENARDPVTILLRDVQHGVRSSKSLVNGLKGPGWKKGEKVIDGMLFRRYKEQGLYVVRESKSGVTQKAKSYGEAYKLISFRV